MFHKNFLVIDKQEEPEKYNIFKQIEAHGKCIIENVEKKDWWVPVSRELGIASRIITGGEKKRLLLPPMKTKDTNAERITVIVPNVNVVVKEEKISDFKSRFYLIRQGFK